MLLLIPGHLPPEVPELAMMEKEMGKTKIDLGDQALDLGKSLEGVLFRLLHNRHYIPQSLHFKPECCIDSMSGNQQVSTIFLGLPTISISHQGKATR